MIDYRENLSMAFGTLLAHKFRAFLTVLGIVVGVVTVIVIASILSGVRESIVAPRKLRHQQYRIFHLNTGVSNRAPVSRGIDAQAAHYPGCTGDQRTVPLRAGCRLGGSALSSRVQIQYKGKSLRAPASLGCLQLLSVVNIKMANGRFFSQSEDAHRMLVAVIGPDAAEAMFAEADPLGKQILIQGHPFTVLGVLEKSKMGFVDSGRHALLSPYGTFHDHALGR